MYRKKRNIDRRGERVTIRGSSDMTSQTKSGANIKHPIILLLPEIVLTTYPYYPPSYSLSLHHISHLPFSDTFYYYNSSILKYKIVLIYIIQVIFLKKTSNLFIIN